MTDRPITVHEDAVFTRLGDDSATILNLSTKRYYSLNETGIRIWELIEESGRPERVAAALEEEFDIDGDTVRRKVDDFVGELAAEGLLRIAPA